MRVEYSGQAFVRFAVLEARRGRDDPGLLFASTTQIIGQLKSAHAARRDTCKPLWQSDPERAQREYAALSEPIRELQALRRAALQAELEQLSEEFSQRVANGTFTWSLFSRGSIKGREIYGISDSILNFFVMKQLLASIRRQSRRGNANRNRLVAQLSQALEGKLPLYVARLDISNFFDSIPHDGIRQSYQALASLSDQSRALIDILLQEYRQITGRESGLPTGVAAAGALADLYLREFDEVVQRLPGVRFYARYVDDIVVVADSEHARDGVVATTERELTARGLQLNAEKQELVNPAPENFDLNGPTSYLGYRIERSGGRVKIRHSSAAEQKMYRRLKEVFEHWERSPKDHGHRRLLLDRLRLLSGNTQLSNSKGRAVTGVYFNYPMLTEHEYLGRMDQAMRKGTQDPSFPPELRRSIEKLSFERGFKEKRFYRIDVAALRRAAVIWRG